MPHAIQVQHHSVEEVIKFLEEGNNLDLSAYRDRELLVNWLKKAAAADKLEYDMAVVRANYMRATGK